MLPKERVLSALLGREVDRPPYCFWHHFKPNGLAKILAEQTVDFFITQFNQDIVKIMPDLLYPQPATLLKHVDQMLDIPKLSHTEPIFQEQISCIRLIRQSIGPEYPLLLTLFSPLTYAMKFIGKKKAADFARSDSETFKKGLTILTGNLQLLIHDAIKAGISGIFFSSMGATRAYFTKKEYQEFGVPYDLKTLEATEHGWLNVSHIHAEADQFKDSIYFDLFTNYPVHALSWADRITGPRLDEAMKMTSKCLMGGLSENGPLLKGNKTEIENEINQAIDETNGGRRIILAPGCSLPDNTPTENLYLAKLIIESIGSS